MLPKADGPNMPFMLPCSSQQGAAMTATSTGTSPVMTERARPPWERTVMGQRSSPRLASSPMRPFTPHSRRVMVPLRMASMISAWTGWMELEASVTSRTPMFSSTRTTWLMTSSPLRRSWCGTTRLPFHVSGSSRPSAFLAMEDGLVGQGVDEPLRVGGAQGAVGALHDRRVDHLPPQRDDPGPHLPRPLDRVDDLEGVVDLLGLGREHRVHHVDLARVDERLPRVAERLHQLGLSPQPLHVLHVGEDGVDGRDTGRLGGPHHACPRVHELVAGLGALDLHAGRVVLGAEGQPEQAGRALGDVDAGDDPERALDGGQDAEAPELEPALRR